MGLRSNADRDVSVSFLFGAGTTPFDADDYGLQSTRILIGAQGGGLSMRLLLLLASFASFSIACGGPDVR
jgi:hypothetical protein